MSKASVLTKCGLVGVTLLLSACQTTDTTFRSTTMTSPAVLKPYQDKAARFDSTISLPEFETSAAEVQQSIERAIAEANAALDKVGQLKPSEVTFENTVRALDDISYRAGLTANRVYLLKEVSTDEKIRDAGTEGIKKFEEWGVGLDYREDVYTAVKAYADTKPDLKGEDAKLLEELLRDYRRAGLSLPKEQRKEVEELRKQLSSLTTDFDSNVTEAKQSLVFTKEELDGVSSNFLEQPGVKTGDNQYTVMANVTFHYVSVMENAKNEATRKKLFQARFNLAKEKNVPVLQQIVELRNKIAHKLGYKSWADYKIEPKMAKTGETAEKFVYDLAKGLQPKFDAELNALKELKAKETGTANPTINEWDWRYYDNQLKKQKYTVDTEQLRVFFPYQKSLEGMFAVYQKIFSLKIEQIPAPYKWVDDLQLYMVSDSTTGEPLGAFYLDMFPREGKYNHFAQFGLIEGKQLANGTHVRPVAALICNFPPPTGDKPSLLSHGDVETLFHEFGHALHTILTRSKHARFAGTSVPRDFVEAPSQMLENWVWDKKVLDSFAADYRDPSKKIPQEILTKMEEARLATIGTFYRRQLSLAAIDLKLHAAAPLGGEPKVVESSNEILKQIFLPVPNDTAFVAYFGHLTGYDGGYYGYAWADAISADLATVFENSPDGFYDVAAGKRLRDEIYAPGGSRDVNESIEKFLGRPRSLKPFLKNIGIESAN